MWEAALQFSVAQQCCGSVAYKRLIYPRESSSKQLAEQAHCFTVRSQFTSVLRAAGSLIFFVFIVFQKWFGFFKNSEEVLLGSSVFTELQKSHYTGLNMSSMCFSLCRFTNLLCVTPNKRTQKIGFILSGVSDSCDGIHPVIGYFHTLAAAGSDPVLLQFLRDIWCLLNSLSAMLTSVKCSWDEGCWPAWSRWNHGSPGILFSCNNNVWLAQAHLYQVTPLGNLWSN